MDLRAVGSKTRPRAPKLRSILGLAGVILALWTVWAAVVLPEVPPLSPAMRDLVGVGVRALCWLVPAAIYLVPRYGRGTLGRLRLNPPPSSQHLLWAALLVGGWSSVLAIERAAELAIPLTDLLRRVPRSLAPFDAPLFEELVFRGVIFSELLQRVSDKTLRRQLSPLQARLRFWSANALASAIFVVLHWPWWLRNGGFSEALLWQSLPIFGLSLVLGFTFERTRSLWPCVLLHWINNTLASTA